MQDIARTRLTNLGASEPVPAVAPVIAAPAPVIVERRVALVIGNSAYPGASRLTNPINDADDVTVALRQVGFNVIEGKDLGLAGFSRVISEFADEAKGADVALIYYAGHAIQFDETNWLMPVDARLTKAFDMRHSSVSLQDLMLEVETRANTTLIFLDACRNNPLADEFRSSLKAEGRAYSDTRGLARININAPQTMVVYAARPNAIAADGHRRNSPFTEAFLQYLPTPGVEIEVLMKRVTAAVSASTDGKQQPERLSRLEREFYFVPGIDSPARAQAEMPSIKAVAQKIAQMISGDKAKMAAYCDIVKLADQMAQLDENKDQKKAQELNKQADTLGQKIGPEYVKLMAWLAQVDLHSKEGKDVSLVLDPLDEMCAKK